MKKKLLTKVVVFIGMFVALDIILTRPFRMMGSFVTFGFVSMVLAGSMMGPFLAGLAALLSDFVGFFAFPQGQPYFVGFAITGILRAVIYGLFYYKKVRVFKPSAVSDDRERRNANIKTWVKAGTVSFLIFLVNVFTIPLWYTMIIPGTYFGFMVAYAWQYAIAFVAQTVTLYMVFIYLDGFINKNEF